MSAVTWFTLKCEEDLLKKNQQNERKAHIQRRKRIATIHNLFKSVAHSVQFGSDQIRFHRLAHYPIALQKRHGTEWYTFKRILFFTWFHWYCDRISHKSFEWRIRFEQMCRLHEIRTEAVRCRLYTRTLGAIDLTWLKCAGAAAAARSSVKFGYTL